MNSIELTDRQLQLVTDSVEHELNRSRDGFAGWVSRNVTKATPERMGEKIASAKIFLDEMYSLLDLLKKVSE